VITVVANNTIIELISNLGAKTIPNHALSHSPVPSPGNRAATKSSKPRGTVPDIRPSLASRHKSKACQSSNADAESPLSAGIGSKSIKRVANYHLVTVVEDTSANAKPHLIPFRPWRTITNWKRERRVDHGRERRKCEIPIREQRKAQALQLCVSGEAEREKKIALLDRQRACSAPEEVEAREITDDYVIDTDQ
jgi:hypothetical protein